VLEQPNVANNQGEPAAADLAQAAEDSKAWEAHDISTDLDLKFAVSVLLVYQLSISLRALRSLQAS
jgi:hypothetical protein